MASKVTMYANGFVKDFTLTRDANDTLELIVDSVTDGVGWMYASDEDGSLNVINLASANVLNISQIEGEEEDFEVF